MPPFPQEAKAAIIAGASSVAAFPADLGVQTALRPRVSTSVLAMVAALIRAANTAIDHRSLARSVFAILMAYLEIDMKRCYSKP